MPDVAKIIIDSPNFISLVVQVFKKKTYESLANCSNQKELRKPYLEIAYSFKFISISSSARSSTDVSDDDNCTNWGAHSTPQSNFSRKSSQKARAVDIES